MITMDQKKIVFHVPKTVIYGKIFIIIITIFYLLISFYIVMKKENAFPVKKDLKLKHFWESVSVNLVQKYKKETIIAMIVISIMENVY